MSLERIYLATLILALGGAFAWIVPEVLAEGKQGLFGPVVRKSDAVYP